MINYFFRVGSDDLLAVTGEGDLIKNSMKFLLFRLIIKKACHFFEMTSHYFNGGSDETRTRDLRRDRL